MAKPKQIELSDGKLVIPILYEDRSVLALDKPAGWMLAPDSWDKTGRNLQLALQSSLNAGDFWAYSRNLKFLRFVHRLDAETTGVMLFAKSPGALRAFSEMFETRRVEKEYLAVVQGIPKQKEWTCNLPLAPDPTAKGLMLVISNAKNFGASALRSSPQDDEGAKDAETHFRVLQTFQDTALVEAHPATGRTHQIRVHLAASGHPVLGDALYGTAKHAASKGRQQLALRAIRLAYPDPFQKRIIRIAAPTDAFLREYGFNPETKKAPSSQDPVLVKAKEAKNTA
ncbi:MAG: Pseudouridine synthase [Pedosphaera sp.]|nr:Pseudouridine synthase [Pedosphaera sp.]